MRLLHSALIQPYLNRGRKHVNPVPPLVYPLFYCHSLFIYVDQIYSELFCFTIRQLGIFHLQVIKTIYQHIVLYLDEECALWKTICTMLNRLNPLIYALNIGLCIRLNQAYSCYFSLYLFLRLAYLETSSQIDECNVSSR